MGMPENGRTSTVQVTRLAGSIALLTGPCVLLPGGN